MNYAPFFLLVSVFGLPLTTVMAEELVRVEVLVFKHAYGQSDRWPVDELPDFSSLVDPRRQAQDTDWSAPGSFARSVNDGSLASAPAIPAPLAPAAWELVPPQRFVHDGQLSDNMLRALERLRASDSYEVLSMTTWLQPLERGRAGARVRIRDDHALDTGQSRIEPAPLSFGRVVSPPPDVPASIYRLDGSIRIRQRQFRHAELDLTWTDSRDPAAPGAFISTADFEVHRLQQSRPIQLGRLEYFDSPWLGALVLVEAWQDPRSSSPGGG